MKTYIIGIAGNKNSGKDTVASMINYIFAVGVTKANYADWLLRRISYDFDYKDRIIHFADGLKDVLSIIYNIPRKCFDDRIFKDEMYYNLKSNTFVKCEVAKKESKVRIIEIHDAVNFNINTILRCNTDKPVYIKLRTLMQYFGTDVCRDNLSDDIWIRQTMSKAVDISERRRLCIIPDVRYSNENEAINNRSDSLYGGVIMIKRKNCESNEHTSEVFDFDCDFNIDNDGSLVNLFYKVIDIIQNII